MKTYMMTAVLFSLTITSCGTDQTSITRPDVMSYQGAATASGSASQTVAVASDICTGSPPRGAIVGTEQADILNGTSGNDIIFALGGNDVVNGLAGDDVICGGDGNDVLNGITGIDQVYGGNGSDSLSVFDLAGGDTADGGEGRDSCAADRGDKVLNCNP